MRCLVAELKIHLNKTEYRVVESGRFSDPTAQRGQFAPLQPSLRIALNLMIPGLGEYSPIPAFIDTGAPYCVVPRQFGQRFAPKRIGDAFISTRSPEPDANSLRWNGLECEFGESNCAKIEMVGSKLLDGPFVVRGKFALAPHAVNHLNDWIILGMNFLVDNKLKLEIGRGARATLES